MDNLVLTHDQRESILLNEYAAYLDVQKTKNERRKLERDFAKKYPNLPKLGSYELDLLLFNKTQIRFIEICVINKLPWQIYTDHRKNISFPAMKFRMLCRDSDKPLPPNYCSSDNLPKFPMELDRAFVGQLLCYDYCK